MSDRLLELGSGLGLQLSSYFSDTTLAEYLQYLYQRIYRQEEQHCS